MSDSADLYPPAPANVPPDLAAPTAGYRTRVIVVLASLILFLVLYVGLVIGSAYFCYYSFAQLGSDRPRTAPAKYVPRPRSAARNDPSLWWVVAGLASGVLCLFLVKGLFKRPRQDQSLQVEITEQEQPALFAFIRQLCRDTRAPFPHRVFLIPEVNAAVFYHSSFFSLFLPTPKNLVIGLGLVNQLNLSEFKAVLAHEFGHFSQNSMKLGSYVYKANHIIGDIVFGRDWLDDVVAWVGRLDLRIAILAWGFTGVLWGVRKMLQGLFQLINFANSALSRQMEFNADLVAVSVTGSDALVHSLARLDFASQALSLTWQDLTAAGDHQLFTRDLFYHQTRAGDHLRLLGKDPKLGEPPPLPEDPAQSVQVFEPSDSGIPLMWATHPSNHDREQNAKKLYLRSPMDGRSPWLLFQAPAAVREKVSQRFYQVVKKGLALKLTDPEVVQAFIDDERAETTYHPRYQGLYDNRFVVLGNLDELVARAQAEFADPVRLAQAQARLYGPDLKARLETHFSRQQEYDLLAGLVQGALTLKGKTFPFRDSQYRAGDAAVLLQKVEKELTQDGEWLAEVDRLVFLVHYAMARQSNQTFSGELEKRYRFHLGVEEILHHLSGQRHQVQTTLDHLAGKRELNSAEFQEALLVFRQAHDILSQQLTAANHLRLPELKNMKADAALGPFLLEDPLVGGLSAQETSLDGKWIERFLQQLAEVFDKVRRIHFKSLGAILAMQEKIAEQWSAQRQSASQV